MAYRGAKLANWLFTQGAETEKRQTMAEIGTPDSLSTRQRRFIAALLETATIRDAAKAAGVGERTAWHYLTLPEVKQEINRRTDGIITQASAGLLAEMAESRATLLEVMRNRKASDASRVSAAGRLLDAGMRLFELVALAERVAELERKEAEHER